MEPFYRRHQGLQADRGGRPHCGLHLRREGFHAACQMYAAAAKYSEFPFSVKYIVMDPGYNEANRKQITDNAALLGIPVEIFDTNIFRVVKWGEGSPCYLCARMRRGHLYRAAKEAGCNKIALGHHFDDVIETILMSMLYGGEIKTMMPKLHSTNFEGMELIRPLYLVREQDIISWARYNGLQFIRCACRFTENLSNEDALGHSKRAEVKQLLAELRKRSGYIDRNIFSSVHHINLSTVIGYKEGEDEPVHTFWKLMRGIHSYDFKDSLGNGRQQQGILCRRVWRQN